MGTIDTTPYKHLIIEICEKYGVELFYDMKNYNGNLPYDFYNELCNDTGYHMDVIPITETFGCCVYVINKIYLLAFPGIEIWKDFQCEFASKIDPDDMTIEQTTCLATLHEIAHLHLNTKCEMICNEWAWNELSNFQFA